MAHNENVEMKCSKKPNMRGIIGKKLQKFGFYLILIVGEKVRFNGMIYRNKYGRISEYKMNEYLGEYKDEWMFSWI